MITNDNRGLHTNSTIRAFDADMFLEFSTVRKSREIIQKENYTIMDKRRIQKTIKITNFFRKNSF